jgi:hypothetical protein
MLMMVYINGCWSGNDRGLAMTWESGVTATLGPDGYDTASFFGPRKSHEITDDAQAYVIQLGSNFREVEAHFHRVDQFQLMVGGRARFGPEDIQVGDLHYSDRFQPYGPFKPHAEGMSFYTLRPNTADGVFYMPESQGRLREDLAAHRGEVNLRRNQTYHLADIPGGRPDRMLLWVKWFLALFGGVSKTAQ